MSLLKKSKLESEIQNEGSDQDSFSKTLDKINLVAVDNSKNSKDFWDLFPSIKKYLSKLVEKSNISNIHIIFQNLSEIIYLESSNNNIFFVEILQFFNMISTHKIALQIEMSAHQINHLFKLFKILIQRVSIDEKFCLNASNYALILKSLTNIASILKYGNISDEVSQTLIDICIKSLNQNLANGTYKVVVKIFSHLKTHIYNRDIQIVRIFMVASELQCQKKFQNRNISIGNLIIVLIIQELLSLNIENINFNYVREISKSILEVLDQFFSQYILSSHRKPDEILQNILKMTDDFIILSQNVKYPASIYLIMTFKRLSTKIFENSSVSILMKTKFILILSKIVSFYESNIKLSGFKIDDFENTIYKRIKKVLNTIKTFPKSKINTLKSVFLCIFAFQVDSYLYDAKIKKLDSISTYHNSKRNLSKSLQILNAGMLIKNKINSSYSYFSSLLENSSVPIRMWTLKSINSIIKYSNEFFETAKLLKSVKKRVFDRSYMVRRCVMEIYGTLIKSNNQNSIKLSEILYNRSLDSSFPVRKSVIANLGEILCQQGLSVDYSEILFRILQRVQDRKGIQKIVAYSVQKHWLVSNDNELSYVTNSIIQITNRFGEEVLEIFSKIFNIINENMDTSLRNSFFQGIRRVLDNIFHIFVSNLSKLSENILNAAKTLCIFAKILPMYFEDHIVIIANIIKNLQVDSDFSDLVFQNICQLFAQIFPYSKNLNQEETILIQEKLLQTIIRNSSCISEAILCLKIIMDRYPENLKYIRELFYNYLKFLDIESSESSNINICRVLYTLSNIIKNFSPQELFKNESNLNLSVKKTGNIFLKFSKTLNSDQKLKSLMCVMNFLIQNPKYFIDMRYKELIFSCLENETEETLKVFVTRSFLAFLKAEENREDLKDEKMENRCSLLSCIIQTYFATLQKAYKTKTENIRRNIFFIFRIAIKLGLINPQRYIIIIIMMLLDPFDDIQKQAIHHLKMIKKKFPGIIESNLKSAVLFAYDSYNKIVGPNIFNDSLKNKNYSFFNEIYNFFVNKFQRRKFIHIFLEYLSAEKHDVEFIIFCTLSIVNLPFRYISDVFYTLNQIEIFLGLFDDVENQDNSNFLSVLIPTFQKLIFLKIKEYLLKSYSLRQEQIDFESPSNSLMESNIPERKSKTGIDLGFLRKLGDPQKFQTKKFYDVVLKELIRNLKF